MMEDNKEKTKENIFILITGTAIVKENLPKDETNRGRQKIALMAGSLDGQYYMDTDSYVWHCDQLKYIKCQFVLTGK